MYKWQINPNVPQITALRAVMELLNRSVESDDLDAEKVKSLIGLLLMLTNCFAQLSLLLDKVALFNLDTLPMVDHMLSALLAMGNLTTNTSDQLKACLTSSTQSQWILKNRRDLFHAAVAAQDFIDEGLDYHGVE